MGLLDSIRSGVSSAVNTVEDAASSAVDTVEKDVGAAVDTVGKAVGAAVTATDDFVDSAVNTVTNEAKSVGRALESGFEAVTKAVSRAINGPPPPPGPPVVQDTFKKLWAAGGGVPEADMRVLATGTATLGLIGQAEALRAQHAAAGLSSADRAQFQGLVNGAANDTEKVELYKALASGHSVGEIATFDRTIHGWSETRMQRDLSLAADHQVLDGVENGVKQQYGDTCAPTTAQALRGEYDPIYALQVRQANTDIHEVEDGVPLADNPDLAREQAALLSGPGNGVPTARTVSGGGTRDSDSTDAVMNTVSQYTGYSYSSDFSGSTGHKLDEMAGQLQQGIATPMRVADAADNGHIVLATAVEGSGPNQRFLIHDPWTGDTSWVTRKQFEDGTFNLAGHSQLSSVSIATAK